MNVDPLLKSIFRSYRSIFYLVVFKWLPSNTKYILLRIWTDKFYFHCHVLLQPPQSTHEKMHKPTSWAEIEANRLSSLYVPAGNVQLLNNMQEYLLKCLIISLKMIKSKVSCTPGLQLMWEKFTNLCGNFLKPKNLDCGGKFDFLMSATASR